MYIIMEMIFDSVKSVNRIWPFWHSQHILDMISIYEIYLCRCHFDNPRKSFPGLSYTITLFARGFEKCKVRVSAKERHGDGIFKCSFIKKRFSSNSQKFWVLIELILTSISSWYFFIYDSYIMSHQPWLNILGPFGQPQQFGILKTGRKVGFLEDVR